MNSKWYIHISWANIDQSHHNTGTEKSETRIDSCLLSTADILGCNLSSEEFLNLCNRLGCGSGPVCCSVCLDPIPQLPQRQFCEAVLAWLHERTRKDLKDPERIWKVQKGSERSRKDLKGPERIIKHQEGPERAKKDMKGHERTKKDLEGPRRTWKDMKGPRRTLKDVIGLLLSS